MGDRPRVGGHLARRRQHLHHRPSRLVDPLPGEGGIGGPRPLAGQPRRGVGDEAAVPPDDPPRGEAELAPPDDVGGVSEGAHHGDPGALLGVGEAMGDHRHLHSEERAPRRGADQLPGARIVRAHHESDTRDHQLGPGGLDLDRPAVTGEAQPVQRRRPLPLLELGLGDRRLEVDVPQHRRLLLVGLAAPQVAEEGPLRRPLGAVVDGGIAVVPVDRQPEPSPHPLVGGLVLDGEPVAELDEVAPAHRTGRVERAVGVGQSGLVRERRVAADPVVVLHAAFGGQAVVVPAHRVEDLLAAHPPVAGDHVGVGVREHVADVERAAHRGGRGVDGEHLGAWPRPVEPVGAAGIPALRPALLEAVEGRLLGDGGHGSPGYRRP